METITINKFDGGMVNDPRETRINVCRICTNFDALTNPHKLTPYKDSESGDSAGSTSKKQNFVIARDTTSSHNVYSLGVKSGASTAEVLFKDLDVSSTNNLANNTWGSTANNQSAGNNTFFNTFTYYQNLGGTVGAVFGTDNTRYIWSYDPTPATWQDQALDLTSFTRTAQGLTHPKDDILYIPYDNKIAKKNGGTAYNDNWTAVALTLPAHLFITSLAAYGNYLAIGCVSITGIGNSIVYLWDRDSSLTTLSESIDWGTGALMILEEIDGELVGISQTGGAVSSFSGIPNNTVSFVDRITFRKYIGEGRSEKIKEFQGGANTTLLPIAKQKVNNRLLFMMSISLSGATREGVWSFGRSPLDGSWSLIHERTPNNDTALSSGTLNNFIVIGDYLFQAYSSGGTFAVSKTNDASSYTATSIYETTINPSMPIVHRTKNKQLVAISVSYGILPSGGQVVLKYRVDATTVWASATIIFTESTANTTKTIRTDASGIAFTSGREYEFRIESTGGAEITELQYLYEILEEQL